MAEEQEQNRSEEATPFKLRRAREKGQVARGMDLGFVGSLVALAAVALIAGPAFTARIMELMRLSLTAGIDRTDQPSAVLATVGAVYWPAFQPLLVLGLAIIVLLVFLEILQLRGIVFSAEPLKPDFTRLNPAKGLKRLFSMKMLKETLKNIVKLVVYTGIAWLMITGALEMLGDTLVDAGRLGQAMTSAATRLLFAFIGAAFFFMVIDQLIARGEFRKQMRMSRRELTRETKDREGEPRFKQKRRQLHQEMRKQAEGLGKLDGSDFLIVNPEHFAVALKYEPGKMDAPIVRARGRNHFAQLLKRKARLLGLPVIADPALARALYADCRPDQPIGSQHFHAVARHYAKLRKRREQAMSESEIHG
jgi:flagellar biosynthetic protein FlhB